MKPADFTEDDAATEGTAVASRCGGVVARGFGGRGVVGLLRCADLREDDDPTVATVAGFADPTAAAHDKSSRCADVCVWVGGWWWGEGTRTNTHRTEAGSLRSWEMRVG